MYLGWREFLKAKFAKPSKYHSIGIEFGRSSIQVAVFQLAQGEVSWSLHHSIAIENWSHELQQWVKRHKLQYTPTHVALSFEQYQLIQVEKPAVPDSETNQALSWSVQDLVSIEGPLVVDHFDRPVPGIGGPQINAVVMSQILLEEIIRGMVDAELDLQSVSAAELVRCDFLLQENDAVINLIQEKGGEVSLNIVKQGLLYFNRRLKGYEQLHGLSPQELSMGTSDALSLDIQRSMDYFESQLRQAPVKKILVTLDCPYISELCQQLSKALALPVEPFWPALNRDLEKDFCIECATSIAAGLFGPKLLQEAS